MHALLDGTTGNLIGDIAVTVMITLSAVSTYARVAFDYKRRSFTLLSMVTAIGFTILAMRMWISIALGIDITIAPISQIGMTLACFGYTGTQVLALSKMRELEIADVRCMRDESLTCMREDRVRAALAALKEKDK